MGYNNGSFSLFNQSALTASSVVRSDSIVPQFKPLSVQYTNVYGSYVNPRIRASGSTSITNAYGLSVGLSIRAANLSILNAYSLSVAAPNVSSGICTWSYGLYVTDPSTSGTGNIVNPYTAFIGSMSGIGTSTPQNTLDISSAPLVTGMTVGTYAGSLTAPSNSVLVSRAVGIGTPSPVYPLDVQGGASAFQVLAPQTTCNQQQSVLATGYNEGFGAGFVGTNIGLSTLSAQIFNLATLNSNAVRFSSAPFDGRYLYFVGAPVARYDVTLPFGNSASYQLFTPPALNTFASFAYGQFDGRYIYYVSRVITRYDTSQPFAATASYTAFDTILLNSISSVFNNSCFDGKYLYLSPGLSSNALTAPSGLLVRYNTQLPFSSLSSYQLFDVRSAITSLAAGYSANVFDGRYVYYAPYLYLNSSAFFSGLALRYDTSASFSSASSYETFDLTRLNSIAQSYVTTVFDGKFVYYIPHDGGPIFVRYNTAFSFTNSLSYSIFDLTPVVGVNDIFASGGFDGRYIYMTPNAGGASTFSGLVTKYDTTAPFDVATSYQTMDATQLSSLCGGFRGFGSDGQYVYFVPNGIAAGALAVNPRGAILRVPCYTGSPTTVFSIGYSTGITISGRINFIMPTSATASTGTSGASPSTASGFLLVYINGNQQLLPYF